jgi:hypothetical protein
VPPTARNLLAARHGPDFLRQYLAAPGAWRLFPEADDRAAWIALPAAHRSVLLAEGEAALAWDWPAMPLALWLDFTQTGNRARFEDVHFQRRNRLLRLALAECVEHSGRFTSAIADGLWLICEETSWCLPAHLGLQNRGPGLPDVAEPVVDLFAAETAAMLAWIDRLLGPQLAAVHPVLLERIRQEVDRRLLTPCLTREDFWWMGWEVGLHSVNNWNPWCNANWLACVLLLEDNPDRRVQAVHKSLRSLDVFLDHLPADGGCDEGPDYWGRAGASLFDALELLHAATGGKINLYAEPLIRETARYVMRAHIDGDWVLNFADAHARGKSESLLIWRLGCRIGDDVLAAFGAWQHRRQHGRWFDKINSPGRLVAGLFAAAEAGGAPVAAPLLRDVWLPNLQIAVARDTGGTAAGFYLAAKGGHNAESHNHNDIGNFVVFLDGAPLLIDLGVETYTAKTFSPQRYEIWTMQSPWHNLPVINGTHQVSGREFSARDARYRADDTAAELQLELAGAWPAAAAINRWTRTLRLERGRKIVLTDDYQLRESREPAVFNFITQAAPEIGTSGVIRLKTHLGAIALLQFDATRLEAKIEAKEITDPQLASSWGGHVHRIRLTEKTAINAARHEFHLTRPPTTPTR